MSGGAMPLGPYNWSVGVYLMQPVISRHVSFSATYTFWHGRCPPIQGRCIQPLRNNASTVVLIPCGLVPHLQVTSIERRSFRAWTFPGTFTQCSSNVRHRSNVTPRYFEPVSCLIFVPFNGGQQSIPIVDCSGEKAGSRFWWGSHLRGFHDNNQTVFDQ